MMMSSYGGEGVKEVKHVVSAQAALRGLITPNLERPSLTSRGKDKVVVAREDQESEKD